MGHFHELGLAPFPCQQTVPAQCYGPDQIRNAYDIQPLLVRGITGAGQTIVIVEAFQSPTVESDLAAFDAIWRLPAPPHLSIVFPDGASAFNPGDPVQISWALEAAADLEWAHAIAPSAGIDLVFAKSASDVDLLNAVRYAVDHRLGDVISQSFGEAEQCAGPGVIASQHSAYERAVAERITLLASTGDQGATQLTCDGTSLLGVQAVSTPASDPDVTAVGGTVLLADGLSGAYQAEVAWRAGGGGFSTYFHRPAFQASAHTGSATRGVPDVAFNAGVGVIVVWSLLAPPGQIGLGVVGGTSLGPPEWAGVVALADQKTGRPLGWLNPALYRLARHQADQTFHDITAGSNSFGGAVGFAAGPGWDAVTGLGSPNVASMVSELARDRR
ncbi:MAG: S53 family peptidase [Acidobacteria bacterium]|nr:S53 family peptidase [Acidobacteriota bacterium]